MTVARSAAKGSLHAWILARRPTTQRTSRPSALAFAADFVDPTEIGASVAPNNPYFPLVPGNRRTYQNPDELFDGDDPEEPELVDLEGSWKRGREGAEAGMLLPFDPVPGTTIRQEVPFGEAEDVIDILSVTADEATAGNVFTCANACLQTRDYTLLEPDVEEHKFYVPDIGLIVESNPDTGERLELIDFTPGG